MGVGLVSASDKLCFQLEGDIGPRFEMYLRHPQGGPFVIANAHTLQ